MILTVDIGNTIIVVGGFEDERLEFVVRLATNIKETSHEYAAKLDSILRLSDTETDCVSAAVVSSVVPQLSGVIHEALRIAFGIDALSVGPGIKTGINIHCDDPSSVGADLICVSVAAAEKYGSPCLIVDMGTATKIIYLGVGGVFQGVAILPGAEISLSALADCAAQLPHIALTAPASAIGKNTVDSMRSGAIFGAAAAVDGMIDRFFSEIGRELPIIITGGLAPTVACHCRHEMQRDDDLVLIGLQKICKKNM